jgi:hypothetical protein
MRRRWRRGGEVKSKHAEEWCVMVARRMRVCAGASRTFVCLPLHWGRESSQSKNTCGGSGRSVNKTVTTWLCRGYSGASVG